MNAIYDKTINFKNKVFFQSSKNMHQIADNSIDLILTSPPYFNIKDYSKNGFQDAKVCYSKEEQIGDISDYELFIENLLIIWKECFRVLKPNGKLVINTPLMPMLKKDFNTHRNRHIFDINSDIQNSIIKNTKFYLMDLYIWNRINSSKKLMFGSYPYPRNFYAQNTSEFIAVYVKDGKTNDDITSEKKEKSKLTKEEWIEYTQQIWNIPIPNKKDIAYGIHSAIMPEEIVKRCVKMYTFIDDIVLDPFAGSGTTLKVAKELGRNYVGFEISDSYSDIIYKKLNQQ